MANEMTQQTHPVVALKKILSTDEIQTRLREMLGNRASSFTNSIINLMSGKRELQACTPQSVVKSAMISASVNLPIDPALGFAAIVPYGSEATWQIMYKGVIQLCIRSGQYESIHDTEVYRDELESYNPITGEVRFKDLVEYKMRPKHDWADVVGFYCRFKLLKGFHASLYMTKEEVMAHAERYSRAYQYDLKSHKQSCPWSTDPIAMGRKTVILGLLKRYGIMSVEMQDAIVSDSEDENYRKPVDSTPIEPTNGRQPFGFQKQQEPQDGGNDPAGDTEDQGEATKTRLCPACNTQKTGKFFRCNGRLVCPDCLKRINEAPMGEDPEPPSTPTPSQGQADGTEGTPEAVKDATEGEPAPVGALTCKNGHVVKREDILPSQFARKDKGELGMCPVCKKQGITILIRE